MNPKSPNPVVSPAKALRYLHATAHSIAAGLPLLALAFFLLVPMFLFIAPETTRRELTDFVGQKT
jgi:hypothetical protein